MLVIPGGESTTIGFMHDGHDLIEPLRKRIAAGMPAFGTCAGAILLADQWVRGRRRTGPVADRSAGSVGRRDDRNGYGRQVDSFEAASVDVVDGIGEDPKPCSSALP